MNGYLFSQKKTQILAVLVLVIGVTAISFLSSLDNDFVNWDDGGLILRNPLIRDLSWSKIKAIFSSFHFSNYHPLVLLSFSLEYALWGLNPFGYHLTNLLLHISNTLLVFALALRLSSHLLPALVAALLFGVHPLHVESVAWVTERKDVLSTLFFLGALLCYLHYCSASTPKSPPPWRGRTKEGGHKYLLYTLSLLAFLLSLLSKPMAVTLPFVLLLCDYLAARAFTWHTLREKVPFVMVSALFSVVTVLAQHSGGAINTTRLSALGDSVLVACWGLISYLSKTLAPVGLSAYYPYPPEVSLRLPAFFLPPILLLALAVGVWISQRCTRTVVFGTLFFVITLLPVLKIIPIGGAAAADRYMYIPSIGLFYLAGVAAYRIYIWQTRWAEASKGAVGLVLGGVILTLAVLTWQRCNVWQDSETLWLSVVEVHPGVAIAHDNLGALYRRKGMLEEAIAEHQKAIAADPMYVRAHNNLGAVYEKKGLLEEAIAEYQKALAIDPKSPIVHNNLGNAYGKKGLLEEAIAEYKKAIAEAPKYAKPHYNLGIVYRIQGQLDAAIDKFHQALALDPTYARAHHDLALAYFRQGRSREAIEHFGQARELGYSGDSSLAEALAPHRQAP